MHNFEKGNVPLTAYRTESPIEQDKVSSEIWGAIQRESGIEDLGTDNKIEFLIMRDHVTGEYSARFIKINRRDGSAAEFKASKELCDKIVEAHLGSASKN